MTGEYTTEELLALLQELNELDESVRFLQAKRKERGAYVKPGLADSVQVAERLLLASFDQLAEDVIASLRGGSDDVATGRIAQRASAYAEQPSEAEVEAALTHYGIPANEKETPIDRSRLEAVLALLLLWRRRHQEIAEAQVESLFDAGYRQAVAEVGYSPVLPRDSVAGLRAGVILAFRADLDRLETALRDGTARLQGLRSIIETAASVGLASALIRDLFSRSRFRVEMFAEALVWRAWSDGFRSGAVEATQTALRTAGVLISPNLSVADLSEEVRESLPHFEWAGPNDTKACQPCKDRFGDPVVALSVDDLPAPEDICRFGRACRHFWRTV